MNQTTNRRKTKVLLKGSRGGRNFIITTTGAHPCVYLELLKGDGGRTEDISHLIDGVVPFLGRPPFPMRSPSTGNPFPVVVGWDHGRPTDFLVFPDGSVHQGRKWSIKDMVGEISSVCNYLDRSKGGN